MDIKEYKCPNCTGAINFDSSTQNMKCPYCDAEFEIKALQEYQKELAVPDKDNFGWSDKSVKSWDANELDDLSTGSCPSCGAEIIGDKNTVAMKCPNCDNVQIIKKRLEGMLKPNYLIPFKMDKKAASQALQNFYRGKRLLPKLFSDKNRIDSINGIYLPYWLFDAQARGHIRYKATKVKAWSSGDYNYTKTDFYSVVRDGSIGFSKIPVDGSERMDDNYMDAIEPFDYTQLKDFNTAYLAGYLAEKYDVDAEKSKERASTRVKKSVETEFAKSVTGYSSVRVESSSVSIENGKINYSLFPVWVLNTKYKNENYLFAMNGQSGRLVGRLPVDQGKFWKYTLLFTGIFGVFFTLIIQLLRLFL